MEKGRKTTQCTLNLSFFRDSISITKKEGYKITRISFSKLGKDHMTALRECQNKFYNIGTKDKNGFNDIYGFIIKRPLAGEYSYIITGPEQGAYIKAPQNMSFAFSGFGTSRLKELRQIDVSGLDVSQTTSFSNCFCDVGNYRKMGVHILGLEKWNTSKAQNMQGMFRNFCTQAKVVNLDLSSFDVSSVREFGNMFENCAHKADTFNIRGIENWKLDIKDVPATRIDMIFREMFCECGLKANYCLDLTGWDISSPVYKKPSGFDWKVSLKIKGPNWIYKELE